MYRRTDAQRKTHSTRGEHMMYRCTAKGAAREICGRDLQQKAQRMHNKKFSSTPCSLWVKKGAVVASQAGCTIKRILGGGGYCGVGGVRWGCGWDRVWVVKGGGILGF